MKLSKSVLNYAIAAALAALTGNAAASGFALIEQSASGLGNAYAGAAASAEDASTVFFNPAGMSRLGGTQVALTAHAIKPSAKFTPNATNAGAALQTAGGNGGDAGSTAFVPTAYMAMQLNDQANFGLGISAPFGLQTQYDPNWVGRFQAIKSKIQTVNVNPSLSYRVSDMVSLGAGLNYQQISGELSQAVNYSAAAFAAGGGGLLTAIGGAGVEGVSTVTGSDSKWGYNFGALFDMGDTRVGVSYRSKINYKLSGSVAFTSVPAALAASPKLANGAVTLDVTMPDSLSFSVVNKVSSQLDILADATWTGWGKFKQLDVIRANGTLLSSTPENWKNTWRVSLGANYRYNEQWLSRFGVAYDQAPVDDQFRTARIPDANRTWLSLGGQYKVSKADAIDVGYAHLFVSGSSINQNQAATGAGVLSGNYANNVNILSAQYTHSF